LYAVAIVFQLPVNRKWTSLSIKPHGHNVLSSIARGNFFLIVAIATFFHIPS